MICVRLCYVCSTWLSCFCSPIFLIFMYIISWGGFQVHIYIYRMTQKFNWYLFGNLLPQMTFYYSGKRKEPQQGLGSRIGLFSLHFFSERQMNVHGEPNCSSTKQWVSKNFKRLRILSTSLVHFVGNHGKVL